MTATTSVLRARLHWRLVAGLRSWAQGSLSDQAAVELLVSFANGRFIRPGCAWIRPCARSGWYWLDADALTVQADTLAGLERRVLHLAAALVGNDPRTHRSSTDSRRRAESRRAVA